MPSQTLSLVDDNADGFENQFGWGPTGAILIVDGAAGPTDDRQSALSFVLTATIPAAAIFTKAYLRLNTDPGAGDTVTINIQVEDADPASNTVPSNGHLPSDMVPVGSGHSAGSIAYVANAWYFGEADIAPVNLATSFQTLIALYGELTAGHRVNVFLEGTTTGSALFDDFSSANPGTLYLEWTTGGQVNARNAIALSSISAINGLAKASVSAINGLTL